MKKTLLVVLPILPEPSDITIFQSYLNFLTPYYVLDYVDPMTIEAETEVCFYEKAAACIKTHYAGFIGFSLGGLILLQALRTSDKPLIIFSVPTGLDADLNNKFSQTITGLLSGDPQPAYNRFMQWVYAPEEHVDLSPLSSQAALRLARGLSYVCEWKARDDYVRTPLVHTHFVGEQSKLVRPDNVLKPASCEVICVSGVGMRILAKEQASLQTKLIGYFS